jgi:hypothetical protein
VSAQPITETDRDLRLTITARGGLPLSMAGYLLRAVGAAYPGTMIETGSAGFGDVVCLRVPHADYVVPRKVGKKALAELAPGPDDEDLLAFTSGIRNGTVGTHPPAWLTALLSTVSEQILADTAAPNYLSMDLLKPDGSMLCTWIVCRPGRPTPHQLRQAADARVALLERQLRDAGIEPVAGEDAQ